MSGKVVQLVQTFSIIFTGSILTTTFSYTFLAKMDGVPIQDIFALILFSIIVVVVDELLFKESKKVKETFRFRIVIFFLFIEAAILGIGWMLNWYDSINGFLIIFGSVCITFLIMYLFFHMQAVKVSNEINQKLAAMREKEKQ